VRIHVASAVVLFCLSIGLSCPSRLMAQGLFGTISGTVTDSSGAAVSGVRIKVTNVDTNVSKTLTSNGAGIYSANSLNPGNYQIEAGASGFKTAIAKGILLGVGANEKVDLTLSPGAVNESVEVTASNTALVQTETSDLGQTVERRELDQLPTSRSVFDSFLLLAAGVSQQSNCAGCGDNGNVRINGDRPRNQDYVLDGTTVVAPVFGGQTVNPSVDTIQEFRIEQNSMSAEYGKAGGGVFIAVSKTGTNAFHGSAYEYTRNRNLNAKNYFEVPTDPKNPYDNNDFGGTIGGPIIKNKLFFFTDFEGIRNHLALPQTNKQVPNAAFRSGDLSALCTGTFDGAGNCSNSSEQVFFPGTSNPVPFNQITSISPISQNLLAIWPNGPDPGQSIGANSLTFNSPSSNTTNRFNPRIDFNPSAADHFFGAYHRDSISEKNFDLIVGPAGESDGGGIASDSITAGWTRTLNPTFLNDFRFGYMHRAGFRGQFGQGFTSPSDFGINGIPDCPANVPHTSGGTKCGTPAVSITGFEGLAGGQSLYEPATTYQFSDIVTKLAGRHNIKAGTEFRHYSIDNFQPNGLTGSFNFTGSQTGNPFADFLFGAMTKGNVQVQNIFVSSRAWSYSFFVQDDFKFSSKLTLNLGLRWQYDQSFHEIHHGDAFFDPCAVAFTHGACTPHWEQFGVNAPDTTFDPSKKQFEPRVGFAWNPFGGLVVRGGYGIMHPGAIGHGRAGDGQPGPNLLSNTAFVAGTNWASLPAISNPDPSAVTAPIPVTSNVSFSFWAPRKQYPTYVQLWNFSIQKQIDAKTSAQIAYVGSHGTHLPINYAYNICQQTTASTAALPNPFNFVGPTTSPYCPAAAAAVNAGAGFNAVYCCLTVNPGWWGLADSEYHSLQAQVDHRFSRGFSLLANFTWSKLIDDSSSDWGGFWSLDVLGQNFYDRRSERSVSGGDIPKRLTLAPVVELPFGHGKRWLNGGIASEVLGGWRVSSIYTISVGSPFGITDNSYGFCNGSGMLSDRPNVTANPLPSSFHQSVGQNGLWFDRSAFDFSGTCPASFAGSNPQFTGPSDTSKAFGNSPRYFSNIRNPGVNNLDFSLQKDFRIPAGEQTRLAFSADFFNLPNHPQFGEPVSDPEGSNFGKVLSTSLSNRTIQLGLHLYF
jgi:hypothetical protein